MLDFNWDKVDDWFEQGLNVLPADRELWLEHAISDEVLRGQVRRLLQADLNNCQGRFLEDCHETSAQWLIGTFLNSGQIGPYRILETVGAGGFGIVFKAIRETGQSAVPPSIIQSTCLADDVSEARASDPQLFAIKILNPLIVGDAVHSRFEREQSSLKNVTHPNVARFVEAGTHEGLPYLVMEYIDGKPLDRILLGTDGKVNCQSVPLLQRLQWFRSICDAVAAAHQQLILHRDIKPGNIIIDRDGRAVVTDFGLAKSVEVSDRSLTFTTSGGLLGTLPFMSPEQVAGKRHLQLSSDVYGLGALLYFMLTGRPPHRGGSLPELSHAICHSAPDTPSKFQTDLPKDLVTICLHCLNRSPVRRYSTAEGLRDDIDRFLEGLPINARPIGTVERLFYWVRRRPAVAALSLLIVLGGLGGLVTFAWLWTQASENFNLAEQKNEQLLRTIDELSNHIRIAETDPGTLKLQGEMLRTVTALYDSMTEDNAVAIDLLHNAGVVWFKLAKVESSLGDSQARDAAFRRAEYYFRRVIENGSSNAEELFQLFHSLASQNNLELALELIQRAIKLDGTDNLYYTDAECDILLRLAHHRIYQGQLEQAETMLESCMENAQRNVQKHPETVWTHVKLAQVYYMRAVLSIARNENESAIELLEESIVLYKHAIRLDPHIVGLCCELGRTQLQLAALAMVCDRHEMAGEYQRQSEAIVEIELAAFPEHKEALWISALTLQQSVLFDLHLQQKEQFAKSRWKYERFLRQRLHRDPDCWLIKSHLAWLLSDPSLTEQPDLQQARQLANEASQRSHESSLDHLIGQVLYRSGQWEEAQEYFEEHTRWALSVNSILNNPAVSEMAFYIDAIAGEKTPADGDGQPDTFAVNGQSIIAQFHYQCYFGFPHIMLNFSKEREMSQRNRLVMIQNITIVR